MLQDGTQQNHFIQVSGGGKKVSYRAGLGYQQEDGVMGDEMQRYNLKLAVALRKSAAKSRHHIGRIYYCLWGIQMHGRTIQRT